MKKVLLILLALAAIGGGAYYIVIKNKTKTKPVSATNSQLPSNDTATTHPKVAPASKCIATVERQILYCDSGFSDYLNVIVGEKVTVKNTSSKVLDFQTYASKPENSMTYKTNSNMDLGKINPGESKTFVAKPLGEYKYRDNNIPSHTSILGIEDDL